MVVLFSGTYFRFQSILRRRERATVMRIVSAVWIVSEIEIEDVTALRDLLHVEIAARAVGLFACSRIAERQKQVLLLRIGKYVELANRFAHFKLEETETYIFVRLSLSGEHPDALFSVVWFEFAFESVSGIDGEV